MKINGRRRGEILVRILTTLGNAAIAMSRHPARNSASVYRTIRDFRELQDLSDRQLRSMSRYIVGKKYVTVHKGMGGSSIKIAEQGRSLLARKALLALKPKKQKWDGLWRIVLFDIPNDMKSARDAFAGLLKTFGFERLQKSVFISPYPCEEELQVVADYFDISDCVDIIIAKNISRQLDFEKRFNLK